MPARALLALDLDLDRLDRRPFHQLLWLQRNSGAERLLSAPISFANRPAPEKSCPSERVSSFLPDLAPFPKGALYFHC